jgi:PilZ domain
MGSTMNRSKNGHKRRSHGRCAVEAELRYRIDEQGVIVHEGNGRLINLSTGGVLFETEDTLPVGIEIELFIPWPSHRHSATPWTLCITGKILRLHRKKVVVKVAHYDYRLHCDEPADSERPLERAG